jgi:ABC-type sugar transport system permease subunit
MSDTSIQQQVIQQDASPLLSASPKRAARWRLDLVGWGFVLPLLIAYAIFLLWPILLGLRMSFFNWSLVGSGTNEFLGFGNYAEALRDPDFWGSLWNTIVFTVISTPILVILSLALALMVNSISRRVQWIYRLAFFAPYTLFGQTYLLTSGGPAFSTRPVIEFIYDSGFTNFRVGFAAATSYLFFILILLISLGQFWFLSRQGRNS